MNTPDMRFFETPACPVPAGGRIVPVRTADGVDLRAAFWPALAHPARGTILIMQGRAEFIEKYFETVDALRGRGFAVAGFDWRGQGGSGRALPNPSKGHVADFGLYRADVEAIAAQLLDPCLPQPVYGLAHSMGGCIALTGASEGWLPVRRLVTTAPMLGLTIVRYPRLADGLARLLAAAGFGMRYVPGGDGRSISTLPFAGNPLSSDEARYARNAILAAGMGPGAIGAPTIAWLTAAYRAMARFAGPRVAAAITIPVLLVGAGTDPVCSTPAMEAFARRLPDGRVVVIPGSRHEILMETDAVRAAFWAAFDDFMAADERDA